MAFKKGDVVWQARHAPEGRRFKITEAEEDAVTVKAVPVSEAVFEESEGNAGSYSLVKTKGDEVELAAANLALAED